MSIDNYRYFGLLIITPLSIQKNTLLELHAQLARSIVGDFSMMKRVAKFVKYVKI